MVPTLALIQKVMLNSILVEMNRQIYLMIRI